MSGIVTISITRRRGVPRGDARHAPSPPEGPVPTGFQTLEPSNTGEPTCAAAQRVCPHIKGAEAEAAAEAAAAAAADAVVQVLPTVVRASVHEAPPLR